MSNRLVRTALLLSLAAVLPSAARAQNGDREGEVQPPLPQAYRLPPPPPLSAEQQLSTFTLPPGLEVELVAAEPLVQDPVAISFGEDGRLWVVEMQSYMRDIDGTREDEPVGSVAVLTDVDGDGRMDERVEFLSGVVLPRAVAPTRDGALVIVPPDLLYCVDEDGDGRADRREVIATGLGGIHSPEHAINGLMPTLDNWFRCANWALSYRFDGEAWVTRPTAGGGQWGISKDDLGRTFFNTNSDGLRGDRIPSHYAVRNPSHGKASGVNVRFAKDQSVWPIRMTPGVNRGYREGLLDGGYLTRFTGACAPHAYRGDALPEEYQGDVFVCEPCGNLLKRFELVEEEDGRVRAENAVEGREFLTSTDERFRPVHLADGPGGGLYVVDMYRGVIQHRLFVTSFLRAQVLERELENPTGWGRIWRIVPAEDRAHEPVDMTDWSWTQVTEALSHPNGWVRDSARRVCVEEGAGSVDLRELLRTHAREAESPMGRAHALYALDGLDEASEELLLAALGDDELVVRLAAARASERWLARRSTALVDELRARATDAEPRFVQQVLFSLGAAESARARAAILALLTRDASTGELRSAAITSLPQQELEALRELLHGEDPWTEDLPGRATTVKLLARCVAREGASTRIEELLALAVKGDGPEWRRHALLRGLLEGRPTGSDGKPSFLRLAARPETMDRLAASSDEESRKLGAELAGSLLWPGRDDIEAPVIVPLTQAEQDLFERGRTVYATTCAQCHQGSGQGEPGKAPPLRHSEWVLGPRERLASIVLAGVDGPLRVRGKTWNMEMPAYSDTDENLAGLLTYLRREWGHGASPVDVDTVRKARERVRARTTPWTEEDLRATWPEADSR